ncbi:MAG: uracil-DNA glycosylase [Candidatus Krumholzibacteriia bacterium]
MSQGPDIQGVAADLLAWIRQNETPEGGWFHRVDAADLVQPVSPRPAPSPPADPEPEETPRSTAPAPIAPAPAALPDDPFAASCGAFLAETLDLIRRQRAHSGAAAAVPPADPAAALALLRDQVLPCTACGLHTTRRNVVFGAGSPTAGLVIIGEAPGRDEDLQGEPFVGRSGQLLTRILGAIGFAREDVFICNILKCRPPENRDPLPPEVAACEPHLKRQLAILQPRAICCLGRVAAQTLLNTDAPLGKLRRTVHFYQDIPVLVTYHPAYLLRNPAAKRDTWDDVRKLRALYDALAGEGTS